MDQQYLKVLLVDEDGETRQKLAPALESWGYVVETAVNGIDALEAARKLPLPGVVLVELFLPGMSGLELLTEFGRSELLSPIPVIVISAGVLECTECGS